MEHLWFLRLSQAISMATSEEEHAVSTAIFTPLRFRKYDILAASTEEIFPKKKCALCLSALLPMAVPYSLLPQPTKTPQSEP